MQYIIFSQLIPFFRLDPHMDVLSWGLLCFQINFSNIHQRTLEIVMVYDLYGYLTKQYTYKGILIWIFIDILNLDQIHWHPSKNRTITLLLHLTLHRFLPNVLCKRFQYNSCDGCSTPTGDVHSSGHLVSLVSSRLGLAYIHVWYICWDQYFALARAFPVFIIR